MDAQLYSEAMGMEMESDAEFTLAEAIEMKQMYDKMGKDCPNAQFYQELADKFNDSIHRRGKSLVKWEQVQDWFQDLRSMELLTQMKSVKPTVMKSVKPTVMKSVKPTVMEVDKVSDERISVDKVSVVKVSDERVSVGNDKELEYQLSQLPNNGSSLAIQSYRKTRAVAAVELSNLLYEAKSSKDLAWYDVKSFVNYRHTASGELEARVRFAKFGKDQDEWLNVKRCVRQRSVPLEAWECEKVKVGDLVMCFRESEDHAVYSDARVLGIERNEHNETEGCTCIFVVRYDYDFSEDRARLSKLCVRPTS